MQKGELLVDTQIHSETEFCDALNLLFTESDQGNGMEVQKFAPGRKAMDCGLPAVPSVGGCCSSANGLVPACRSVRGYSQGSSGKSVEYGDIAWPPLTKAVGGLGTVFFLLGRYRRHMPYGPRSFEEGCN